MKSNQPKYRNESIGRVHVCVFTSASAPFALYWSLYEWFQCFYCSLFAANTFIKSVPTTKTAFKLTERASGQEGERERECACEREEESERTRVRVKYKDRESDRCAYKRIVQCVQHSVSQSYRRVADQHLSIYLFTRCSAQDHTNPRIAKNERNSELWASSEI